MRATAGKHERVSLMIPVVVADGPRWVEHVEGDVNGAEGQRVGVRDVGSE